MGNGDLSARAREPGCEAGNSPTSSAKVNISGDIPPLLCPFFFLNHFTSFCEEFYSCDEGSEILKNMGAYVPKYTVSNPRQP